MNSNINDWGYERVETTFKPIPAGAHRVRIVSAEKNISKSGNQMITIKLDVSGYSANLWHYITFMPVNKKITNRMLTQLFDSFDITESQDQVNLNKWAGKIGGAVVKTEEYQGEEKAKIHYFIPKQKQEKLPAWVEPERQEQPTVSAGVVVSDDDLPF